MKRKIVHKNPIVRILYDYDGNRKHLTDIVKENNITLTRVNEVINKYIYYPFILPYGTDDNTTNAR